MAAVRRSATSEHGITPSDLCEHHGARVYKFATMVAATRQDADDLAHDALERAIRGLATFDASRGQIEGWLWRIVVNAARDAGRVAAVLDALDRNAPRLSLKTWRVNWAITYVGLAVVSLLTAKLVLGQRVA